MILFAQCTLFTSILHTDLRLHEVRPTHEAGLRQLDGPGEGALDQLANVGHAPDLKQELHLVGA